MKVLLFLLLIAAFVGTVSWAANVCHTTGRTPSTPYGLGVCHMYSHNACCLSGYDGYIKNAYASLITGGTGCKPGNKRTHTMLYAFLKYLCIPCDPNEPSYRFESITGDIVDGGIVPPSANSNPGEQTWRICNSFLYGARGKDQGIWGQKASQYDECGVTLQTCLSTPIFNITTATFTYPSSTCQSSTDLTIPSIAFEASSDPALEMLSLVAQTMSDFQIVIVDDNNPLYDYKKTPCFGRSTDGAPSPVGFLSFVLALLAVTSCL